MRRASNLHLDRGYFYFVKRVPAEFRHVDRRTHVRKALKTAAIWEAARSLVAARGYGWKSAEELARPGNLAELVERVRPLASPDHVALEAEVSAMLGLAAPPAMTLTDALDQFFKLTRDRIEGKSERQVRHWQNDRRRAVRYFIEAVDDLPLAEIGRPEALRFREWWQARIEAAGGDPETANKSLGHVSDVFSTVADLLALELENPFRGLRLRARLHRKKVPPFSVDFLRTSLLAPAALDGNGALTLLDFLAFQNLFDAGDPLADFDGDGRFTLFDFLAFQNAFDAGCP